MRYKAVPPQRDLPGRLIVALPTAEGYLIIVDVGVVPLPRRDRRERLAAHEASLFVNEPHLWMGVSVID